MQALNLAQKIHELRNTDRPSQVIHPRPPRDDDPRAPIGVLLLKPSSGYFPLPTIQEILERLVVRYHYHIRSVVWWHGQDLKTHRLMSLHYPGFHRVAHGGLGALATHARAQLQGCYEPGDKPAPFVVAFGIPFDWRLVQTPYALAEQGISPEKLNELWELDRSSETAAVKRMQRLDDDTLSLALQFPAEENIPVSLQRSVVILVNGFFAKLEKDFESRGCIAMLIQKHPASTTSWAELRQKFAGSTNPAQAPPDTIRGDAVRGRLPVETVSILANVIHLSATEAEGRREAEAVWWEPTRFAKLFGSNSGDWPAAK